MTIRNIQNRTPVSNIIQIIILLCAMYMQLPKFLRAIICTMHLFAIMDLAIDFFTGHLLLDWTSAQ